MFAAEKNTIEIDRQTMSPSGEIHILKIAAGTANPGAVEQNIKTAVAGDNIGTNSLPLGFVRGVMGDELTFAATGGKKQLQH